MFHHRTYLARVQWVFHKHGTAPISCAPLYGSEGETELEGRKMLSGPLSLVNLQWVSFIFILLH